MKSNPCEGCALSEGAAANCEPRNHLAAMIAVLTPFPFYCHEGMDWQNPVTHHCPPQVLKRLGQLKLCEGWRREVRALAETGYYKGEDEVDAALRRTVGRAAFVALEKFLTEGLTPAEKESAREQLSAYVHELVEKKRKFLKGRATALAQ